MFTKIFNSSSIGSLIILVILAITVWAKTFINMQPMYDAIPVSPFYNFLLYHIGNIKILCAFISIILVVFEAILINYILAENELIPRNSYISAFMFIMATGLFSDVIILNPIIFSNLFIIIAIWLFFKLYEETEAYGTVFNIGMLISIASLFYFPSIIMIFIIWVGFIIYRIFSWREWFVSIIGCVFPYLFLGTYYLWNDNLLQKIIQYNNVLSLINFYNYSPSNYTYIITGFLLIILIFSFFRLLTIINEKAIRIRKFISFMLWFFFISFFSLSFSSKFAILGFIMLLTSASALFSLYISYSKKPVVVETILVLFVFLLISGRLGIWNFYE